MHEGFSLNLAEGKLCPDATVETCLNAAKNDPTCSTFFFFCGPSDCVVLCVQPPTITPLEPNVHFFCDTLAVHLHRASRIKPSCCRSVKALSNGFLNWSSLHNNRQRGDVGVRLHHRQSVSLFALGLLCCMSEFRTFHAN